MMLVMNAFVAYAQHSVWAHMLLCTACISAGAWLRRQRVRRRSGLHRQRSMRHALNSRHAQPRCVKPAPPAGRSVSFCFSYSLFNGCGIYSTNVA
jgi:hypothetical protein